MLASGGVFPTMLLLLRPLGPQPAALQRRIIYMASTDDADSGGELLSPGEARVLRDRIARIAQGGLGTPKDKLFEIATEKPPSVVLREFFTEAPPLVQQAMQDAVVSLLGALPPMQVAPPPRRSEASISTRCARPTAV